MQGQSRIRYFRVILLPLLAITMSAIPSAFAQEKVRLRVNVQVGEIYAFSRANETQMTTKATADNGQSQTFDTKMYQHRAGKMEILAVSDGKPTSVRLTFADTCETVAEMPNQPTRKVPYPYAGHTVTVTRAADGTIHDDFKGEADPQSQAELLQVLDPDKTFHPDKEIAVGEEWAGDPKEIAKQFQLTGPNDRAGMTLKLLSVKEENGRRMAEVKVSTAVMKEAEGLANKTILQGTVLIDMSTGNSLNGDMKGTITQSGNGSNPGPDGRPVNYHVDQEGTLTITMRFEPVEAPPAPIAAGGNPPPARDNPLDRPSAPSFAGKFTDGKLTLDLTESAGAYSGTITLGQQNFKATGSVRNGTMDGSFDASGPKFTFMATLVGDIVTLKTGNSTYTLKRVATNPLDRPAPANPLDNARTDAGPAPAPQPNAVRQDSKTMRFETYVLKDDPTFIGGEVARALIPAGWKVDGGVVWDLSNTSFPAQIQLQVYNPNGVESFGGYPILFYYWSSNSWTQQTMPPGTNYGGAIVRQPVNDVFQAIMELAIPRYRRDLQNARIVEKEELPKLADLVLQSAPAVPGFQNYAKGARIRFEYDLHGQTVQEDLRGVLNAGVNPQLQFMLWNVSQLTSMRGPKGKLDELKTIGQVLDRSAQPNIQWMNKYTQFVQMRQNIVSEDIRQAGVRSRIIAGMSNDISNTMRESYENQQRVNDRISEARSQTMRGVTAYSTGDGTKVELPSQYNYAWRGTDGTYIVTNDAGYNPNSDLNSHANWTQMQQAR